MCTSLQPWSVRGSCSGTRVSAAAGHARIIARETAWDRMQPLADAVLAAATMWLWAPVLCVLLLIKLAVDGRPISFSHLRLGRDGEPFLLHKIRTTPREFS